MKKKYALLLLFVAVKFILQYSIIGPQFELHRDEFLHIDQGRHLAWGYFSVPPFTSWTSAVLLFLGGSVFWVKFFPALFGALTLFLVWKIIDLLDGKLFATALGLTAVTFSALLRLNMLYQPNSADIFFWTLLFYFLTAYSKSKNSKWLLYSAVAVAFGFLNKYNILFLLIGLVPAMLIANREIFTNKWLYFSAVLAMVLVLPNLYWQYAHNFPVIAHMKELQETQLVNFSRGDFLKEQLFFFFGSIYVLIAAFIAFFRNPQFKPYRFLFWTYVFTIALFIYCSAKGYYSVGLYPVLIAFGAVYLESILHNRVGKFLKPVLLICPVVFFFLIIKLAYPVLSPEQMAERSSSDKAKMHRWEDGKEHLLSQDFADMLGWSELAGKVDAAYLSLADKQNTLIICDNYGEAGAVNFYTKVQGLRAVSMNADYINWFPDWPVQNLILIKETADDEKNPMPARQAFGEVRLMDSVTSPYARERATVIYLCTKPKFDIRPFIEKERHKRLGKP